MEIKGWLLIFLVIVLIIVIIAGLFFLIGRDHEKNKKEELVPEPDRFKVGMVADIGGLDDHAFNDAALQGLKQAEQELGIETVVIVSRTISDYKDNLESLVNQGCDMVWAVGALMENALYQVADKYPDLTFAIIDGEVSKKNVISISFKEEEGSFLMGIIAGLMSESGIVGFVGGMNIPIINKFQAGYQAGFKAINSSGIVLSKYTGLFGDPAAGKEAALSLYQQGADIIFHASGACGLGVIEAAREKGFFVLGVDSPQYHLSPYYVLSSMVKRVDVAIYSETKKVVAGNFQPGLRKYGLKDDGVGYSDHAFSKIPPAKMGVVNSYRDKIIKGELSVPAEIPGNYLSW